MTLTTKCPTCRFFGTHDKVVVHALATQAQADESDGGRWNGYAVARRCSLLSAGVHRLCLSRWLRRLSPVGGLQKTDRTRQLRACVQLDRRTRHHILDSDRVRRRLAGSRVLLEPQAVRVDVVEAGPDADARPQWTVERRGTSENILHQCSGRQSVGGRGKWGRRDVATRTE